jgi:hypothetical protein
MIEDYAARNEYKSNSNKSKQEQTNQHKVEKIVTGTVITKKKTGLRKFTEEFISDDAKNIKSYVIKDVIIPALKKVISDIVRDGIDMILYGGVGDSGRRSNVDRISYRNYYDNRSSVRRDDRTYSSVYDYDDIILATMGEARDVLSRMDELIDTYGMVSVADLYDLVGISGNYTDNKYGWTNLKTARITRVRDGYRIEMPRAMVIE